MRDRKAMKIESLELLMREDIAFSIGATRATTKNILMIQIYPMLDPDLKANEWMICIAEKGQDFSITLNNTKLVVKNIIRNTHVGKISRETLLIRYARYPAETFRECAKTPPDTKTINMTSKLRICLMRSDGPVCAKTMSKRPIARKTS